MPKYKKTKSVLRTHVLSFVFFGLLPVAVGAWCLLNDTLLWLVAPAVAMLCVGTFLQNRRFQHFRCPQCGQALHRKRTLDHSPITFTCQQCDVIWDTGFDGGARSSKTDRSRWESESDALPQIQTDDPTEFERPDGVSIEESDDFDGRTYRWKPTSGGRMRYYAAAFVIFWLCGWVVGVIGGVDALLDDLDGAPKVFLVLKNVLAVFWLPGWTIAGICAMFALYLLLRPLRPESMTLTRTSFQYDSGSSRIRRQRIEIMKEDLDNLILERLGERRRVYVERGADRVEIGRLLRDYERNWLAAVISEWKAT